jgi:GNAT superfamily N-acetyltransferase
MALAKTVKGFFRYTTRTIFDPENADDPFFIFTPKPHREPKVYPVFEPIAPRSFGDIFYRVAVPDDLAIIRDFTDYWLSGKGYAAKIPGAGHDYFIPTQQHIGYLQCKTTLLALDQTKLIGWAVRQRDGSLIHLLVASNYRGRGIGAHLLELLTPTTIRSKSDQSTGNPLDFYLQHGYEKTSDVKIGKHKNIDILVKKTP